jgi:hypothetical protein
LLFFCLFIDVEAKSPVQFSTNYVFIGAGYGMSLINHSSLNLAVEKFNLYNQTYYNITNDIAPPAFFDGPVFNLGVVNTNNPTDWMINVSLGIYGSSSLGVLYNYDRIEPVELKNNLTLFSAEMAYMPVSSKYLDLGIGLGATMFRYEILSKTGQQAYYKNDEIFSYGIHFMSYFNFFPLGKVRSLLFSLRPYYHINLSRSYFSDIFTVSHAREAGEAKGYFTHAGLTLTLNQPYKF